MTSNQFPQQRPKRSHPDRGRLMYGNTELMQGEWGLMKYYERIYKSDPTLNKKKLKVTY